MFIANVKEESEEGKEYLWKLNAQDKQAALDEIKERTMGGWLRGEVEQPELKYRAVTLYEVTSSDMVPLTQWYRDGEAVNQQEAAVRLEATERQEYERLKLKFEPKV